ncbi:uncharacterized protein LOC142344793 isoform X1 [Convolutriloba macropyga]|uniref:uncharacterized protein LOC142344793 isoform X1 n=1 Tax=Convolutriloba macropyga TaxID=536237 RepID=UPI003F5276B6
MAKALRPSKMLKRFHRKEEPSLFNVGNSGLELNDLPSHFVQSVCQILIRSKSLKSVFSLRATCRGLYELINGFPLFLFQEVWLYDTLNFSDLEFYIEWVTQKTRWRVESLLIRIMYMANEREHTYPDKLFKLFEKNQEFYGSKLRLLHVETDSEGDDMWYINKLASILCNPSTDIDIGCLYSYASCRSFTYNDSVKKLELYVQTDMSDKCPLWQFKNLENLRVLCFNKTVDASYHSRLRNLRELRVGCIKTLFHMAPLPCNKPWFPLVTYLQFLHYQRNEHRFDAFVQQHFPNLERLDLQTDYDFVQRYLKPADVFHDGGANDFLPSCLVTLKTSVFLFCSIAIPENLKELFLEMSFSKDALDFSMDYILYTLQQASIRILNLHFCCGMEYYDIAPVSFKTLTSIISKLIASLPDLEVLCISVAFEVSQRNVKSWFKRNQEEILKNPKLKTLKSC